MIEPITLARPYAKAAFEHARGAGELAQWQDALAQLAAVTRDNKVSVMLRGPNQTAKKRALDFPMFLIKNIYRDNYLAL